MAVGARTEQQPADAEAADEDREDGGRRRVEAPKIRRNSRSQPTW